MIDDEKTIFDPQFSEPEKSSEKPSTVAENGNKDPKQKSDKGMGIGEKAAYAAGGAVFGAGVTMAGQAMASPSDSNNEIKPESPEVVTAEEVNSQPTAEMKESVNEVAGVTVEATGTTVHVTGAANIDVNNGNVHIATSATAAPDSTTSHQPNPSQTEGHGSATTYRTASHQTVENNTQPAPEPEDAIVATATGVRVAQVDDNVSFSQAFADARAQVGPGGIFEWHGRVYGTYYKDEWDNMTPAERHDFQRNIEYSDVLSNESMAQHHNDMARHSHSTHDSGNHATHHTSHQQPEHNEDNYQPTSDDNEVHVLDVAQTDINEDGIYENAALLEVNGHEIIIVDFDRDGMADVAIADVNGDGELEYKDLSGENVAMPTQSDGDMYMAQNDSAPDYMNDANVDSCMA